MHSRSKEVVSLLGSTADARGGTGWLLDEDEDGASESRLSSSSADRPRFRGDGEWADADWLF
jgi:hypothetical protein